jgi:hypothetical protein
MVRTAARGTPRLRPPVGFVRARFTVRLPTMFVLSMIVIGTVTLACVPVNVTSWLLTAMKSVPFTAVPPTVVLNRTV